MFLATGDIAPINGEYDVLTHNGENIGKVLLKKGDVLPPLQSATHHYQIDYTTN